MSERSQHHHQVIDLVNHVCATVSTRAQPGTCCDSLASSSLNRDCIVSTRAQPGTCCDSLASSSLNRDCIVSTRAQPGTCCDSLASSSLNRDCIVSTRAQPGTCCDSPVSRAAPSRPRYQPVRSRELVATVSQPRQVPNAISLNPSAAAALLRQVVPVKRK